MRFPGRLLLALLVAMVLPASTLLAETEPAREAIPAVPASEKPPASPAPEQPPSPPSAPPAPPGSPAPPETPRPPSSARAPRAHSDGARTQLFQVAVVVGGSSATSDLDADGQPDPARNAGLDDLPRSVSQALVDLGDFLPYKRYLLLDTVLIRTSFRGVATMKGPGGRELRVELGFRPGNLEGEPELMVHGFEVTDVTRTMASSTEVGGPDGFKHRGETSPAPSKTIISTSFGMSVGETLVVGSSRLNGGDTALILLVTAPR